MHLIVSVVFFAFGALLINSAPFEEKIEHGSQKMRDGSEVSAVEQNSPIIPLVIARHLIKARGRGFCFRRLSLSLAPGTQSGFKGWIRKHNSGYVATDEKLYLFFRCGPSKIVRQLNRIRRKRSPQNTPPLPRPCVNGTMPTESEAAESEESENGEEKLDS